MKKRRNRAYKRDEPFRDARLFVIACEGEKREKEYFQALVKNSKRVKVEILAPDPTDAKDRGKSAPKWVHDRVVNYVEDHGLDDHDQLWIVMDIDKWKEEDLRAIFADCQKYHNWHLALSNPAFEVWLYMHVGDIDELPPRCKLKTLLHQKVGGSNSADDFVVKLDQAIKQAEEKDNKDFFIPENHRTKVYLLAQELQKFVKNDR